MLCRPDLVLTSPLDPLLCLELLGTEAWPSPFSIMFKEGRRWEDGEGMGADVSRGQICCLYSCWSRETPEGDRKYQKMLSYLLCQVLHGP